MCDEYETAFTQNDTLIMFDFYICGLIFYSSFLNFICPYLCKNGKIAQTLGRY